MDAINPHQSTFPGWRGYNPTPGQASLIEQAHHMIETIGTCSADDIETHEVELMCATLKPNWTNDDTDLRPLFTDYRRTLRWLRGITDLREQAVSICSAAEAREAAERKRFLALNTDLANRVWIPEFRAITECVNTYEVGKYGRSTCPASVWAYLVSAVQKRFDELDRTLTGQSAYSSTETISFSSASMPGRTDMRRWIAELHLYYGFQIENRPQRHMEDVDTQIVHPRCLPVDNGARPTFAYGLGNATWKDAEEEVRADIHRSLPDALANVPYYPYYPTVDPSPLQTEEEARESQNVIRNKWEEERSEKLMANLEGLFAFMDAEKAAAEAGAAK